MINTIKNIIKNKLYREIEGEDIRIEELKQFQNEGAIIIDVRSPQEYKEGHINGSISIPDYELKEKAGDIIRNKDKVVVVYCSSGGRSKKAQKMLKKIGYQNVYNLYNGFTNY